mgnify:CR=1 FL=1
MKKLRIKVGDFVKVIAGSNKGSEGKIVSVNKKKQKVIIEGLNMVKKHIKPNSKNPQGGIQDKEAPIHISNVSVLGKDVSKNKNESPLAEKKPSSKKSNEKV